MKAEKALIIMAKTPEMGKVKTRLAQGIGDEKALLVYENMLEIVLSMASKLANTDKLIFFSPSYPKQEKWASLLERFKLFLQEGKDLGEKMKNAFELGFDMGYKRLLTIGADCPELQTPTIENGFLDLETHDVVIGPTTDGGYYALGLNQLYPELFEGIQWSTDVVAKQTLAKTIQLDLTVSLLLMLSDIDKKEDYDKWIQKIGQK